MPPTEIAPGSQLWRLRRCEVCDVQTKARFRWLLLNHKEPSVRIIGRLAQRFVFFKIETDKRDVWLERAAEEWMTFILGLARYVQFRPGLDGSYRVDD